MIKHHGDLFDDHFSMLKQSYIRAMKDLPHFRCPIKTLIHGDFKVDNLLFRPRPDPEVAILDWQGLSVGTGIEELAGFIPRSMSIESRRKQEPDLLQIYFCILSASYPDNYRFADMIHDYKTGLLMSFAGNIEFSSKLVSGELSDGDTKRDRKMSHYYRQTMRRKYQAIRDCGALKRLSPRVIHP